MKPGDKIKRIKDSFGIAQYGEIYTVASVASNNVLCLVEDNYRSYDASAFIVVESSDSTFIPEFLN